MDFDGLTIEGTKKNRKKTILEGKNAKGELGAAQNGIEAISVDGLVLRNMWARNYQSNGFFIHASNEGGQHCVGYTMDNLLASDNRSYGLFAKNCLGGKMVNSAGYHQGDSAFYVGETPCDSRSWNVYQSDPLPEEAAVDAAEERPQLRKRARLLGHQLQVREDRRIGVLQQRRRDRPEHARQRGLRAQRLEHHRTQLRVLEQLQLLPRQLGLPHGLRGARRTGRRNGELPDRGRDHLLRRRQQHRPPQQRLRQLQVGDRLLLGARRIVRSQRGRRSQKRQQPVHRKHDGPRRSRPQRGIRLLQRRHRRRQLLVAATTRSRPSPPATATSR